MIIREASRSEHLIFCTIQYVLICRYDMSILVHVQTYYYSTVGSYSPERTDPLSLDATGLPVPGTSLLLPSMIPVLHRMKNELIHCR